MKKTNITCRLGFHAYKWDWRKLCHSCVSCGAVKDDLFTKIKNIILTVALILSVIALILVIFNARANNMSNYEKAHNCRYDYNDLCYTQEQKPWLFND